ncbi:hypothetical protein [Prosthecobacter sp.]|uniref:hypothetical protein n=1 Tax=Prosthecobacter sp. TaxID=1965333 RepID=UPI002488A373|nr:hypothetical protein [Prosthecobacter sp.]MDI1311376.1 hypothetical protein [Prosthecobacter sp.]
MDHLAASFGEREKAADGSKNASLSKVLGVDPTVRAWCGTALGKAMGKAKIAPPNTPGWAGNWRIWGKNGGPNAGGINVGDVYHIKYDGPEGHGHVATVVGISKDGTQVFCLGGNQNDGLNISAYPIGEFTDATKPGKSKGATIVFKKPEGQSNNIPAPTFDYNANTESFNILAGLTR